MRGTSYASAVAAFVVVALGAPVPSAAQLGFYSLPKDNFIWRWGNTREGEQHGFADLDVNGSEAGFNCALTARTRTSSALSPSDLRQLESDLRSRLDFVYGASEAMNYLERLGSLDWGILDCRKPEAGPVDEAERAQREARAKEKMLREIERRRARQRADD
jgi:hypothetical protein